jgi:hypothetical protein
VHDGLLHADMELNCCMLCGVSLLPFLGGQLVLSSHSPVQLASWTSRARDQHRVLAC